MNIYLECLIIGLISIICNYISYKIIYNNEKKQKYNINFGILFFILGFLLHYIIKKNRLTEFYCKKICYGDKCFLSCKYI